MYPILTLRRLSGRFSFFVFSPHFSWLLDLLGNIVGEFLVVFLVLLHLERLNLIFLLKSNPIVGVFVVLSPVLYDQKGIVFMTWYFYLDVFLLLLFFKFFGYGIFSDEILMIKMNDNRFFQNILGVGLVF